MIKKTDYVYAWKDRYSKQRFWNVIVFNEYMGNTFSNENATYKLLANAWPVYQKKLYLENGMFGERYVIKTIKAVEKENDFLLSYSVESTNKNSKQPKLIVYASKFRTSRFECFKEYLNKLIFNK